MWLAVLAPVTAACTQTAEGRTPVATATAATTVATTAPSAATTSSTVVAHSPDDSPNAAPGTGVTGSASPTNTSPTNTLPRITLPPTTLPGSTSSTSTTTTLPPLDVYDAACVVQVAEGDTPDLIADRFDDETVTGPSVLAENRLPLDAVLHPGQLLDVCVDNGVDDITGEPILERNAVLLSRDVQEQQTKLNELFAGLGIRELLVDGISGPVTRQRLCAARLALGLPVSTADMVPGSEEEQLLMATTSLTLPFTTALLSPRWILIDRTCQIMFVGEGVDRLVFVFPTSTGAAGFETRDQDRSPVVRFNPALDNGGWHNSSIYPVAEDNPLNGNMYKPLYFDRGQAIHGANNVPTSPQSKGCARLRVEHQDMLLGWLGLSEPTSSRSRINVTVNVQGTWVPI